LLQIEQAFVDHYTACYELAILKKSGDKGTAHIDDDEDHPMGHAVKAQLAAIHLGLMRPNEADDGDNSDGSFIDDEEDDSQKEIPMTSTSQRRGGGRTNKGRRRSQSVQYYRPT
jgi:hypothetical protein